MVQLGYQTFAPQVGTRGVLAQSALVVDRLGGELASRRLRVLPHTFGALPRRQSKTSAKPSLDTFALPFASSRVAGAKRRARSPGETGQTSRSKGTRRHRECLCLGLQLRRKKLSRDLKFLEQSSQRPKNASPHLVPILGSSGFRETLKCIELTHEPSDGA